MPYFCDCKMFCDVTKVLAHKIFRSKIHVFNIIVDPKYFTVVNLELNYVSPLNKKYSNISV